MKLVCDACGSKYSISDDRVAGKTFKIRCKKCSQVIVVRGVQPVEAAAPEPAPSGEWHVVIDGQQSGPFEREALMRRHAAGELDDESFVWRDGMEEWAALGTIVELRGESTHVEPAADAPAHELFATSAPAGNARFASSSSDVQEQLVASAPASGRANGGNAMTSSAFAASARASGRASGRAAMTSSAFVGSAVVVADDSKRLLAERNENSVLFTLGNLAKLASPAPSKTTSSSATGTEGSGLIDIRALASTFASPSAKAATAVGSIEDLPVYAPTTFGEPIVLMPTASRGPDRKLMYMLLAAIALLAIVATVLVLVVMRSSESGGGQLAARNGETADGLGTTGNGTDTSAGNGTTGNGSTANGSTGNGSTGNGTTGNAATGNATGNGTTGNAATGYGTTGSTSNGTTATSTNTSGRPTSSTSSTRPTTSSTRPTTSTSSTRPTTSSATSTSTSSTRPTTSSTTSTSTSSTRPTSTSSASTTSTRRTTSTSTTRPATAPDRVQCEFLNYADKGCEVFRPATSNTGASNLPDNLDRGAIAAGLATIRAQACGGRSSARGDVSVTIKVNADGGVSGVTIKSSPDPVLSSCVTAAAGKGTFAKTKRGASFGYVWRF